MAFQKTELSKSWFERLNLEQANIQSRAPGSASWSCALDVERELLFTQLGGSSYEMRDGFYYYLLAIGSNLVVAEWDNGWARVLPQGAASSYTRHELETLINEGAVVACHDQKPFLFRPAT